MAVPHGKAGRRARQGNVDGPRTDRVNVRLSKKDRERLAAIAKKSGMTIPRLLVERALADESGVTRSDHEFLLIYVNDLRQEINRVGVNLNQIAYATNANSSLPVELRGALAEILVEVRDLAHRSNGLFDKIEER